MIINELEEDVIIPETPKVLDNEVLTIYLPLATYTQPGIMAFPDECFTIIDGRVYINTEFVNKLRPVIIDGFWYIGGENTGISATGNKGDKGDKGEPGDLYILNEEDKNDIANLVYGELLKYDGGVVDGHYS